MLITKQWIEKNYNKFNEELFGGRLPNIEFKVNHINMIIKMIQLSHKQSLFQIIMIPQKKLN